MAVGICIKKIACICMYLSQEIENVDRLVYLSSILPSLHPSHASPSLPPSFPPSPPLSLILTLSGVSVENFRLAVVV